MRHDLQVTSGRKQNILLIAATLFCLNYPACKVIFLGAVLFTVVCSLWFCCNLHSSSVYSKIFPPPPKKNHLNQNAFCLFYLQHLSETSLLSGRIERDIPQNAFRSPCKMPYIYFRFLTVLEEIRTKVCNIRFVENYSSWRRVISCGRTDGRTA